MGIIHSPCIMTQSDEFDNRHYSPMLVGQWQNAVTRKDMVEEFSFRDFIEVHVEITFEKFFVVILFLK